MGAFRKWLIVKLGGQMPCDKKHGAFATLDEAIEHIRDCADIQKKYRILTLATKKLFNTITADDILHENEDGSWVFEGKPLTNLEVKQLKSEAQAILNTRMWKVLEKDIQYLGNKAMFINSKTEHDLTAGKLILFINNEKNTRLKRMQSVKVLPEA